MPRSGSSTSVAGSVGSQDKYDALHDTDLYQLTATEKRYLLLSERGDVAGVRDLIAEFKDQPDELNINCVDPLNRSSLISGIENENIDMIRLLLEAGILVKVGACSCLCWSLHNTVIQFRSCSAGRSSACHR